MKTTIEIRTQHSETANYTTYEPFRDVVKTLERWSLHGNSSNERFFKIINDKQSKVFIPYQLLQQSIIKISEVEQ